MIDTATNLDPWQVSESDFPSDGAPTDRLRFLLRYAVLAPSSHNTQPWRFAVDCDDEIKVYADKTRWLRVADADQRELHISIGCAIENLIVAAERFGYRTAVDYFPIPDDEYYVARLVFRPARDEAPTRDLRLFDCIAQRRTNHDQYDGWPVPEAALAQLAACCTEPHIALLTADDDATREKIDALVLHCDAIQFADPAYREELAYWIGQGVFGTSWLLTHLGKFAVAHLNLGGRIGRQDSDVLMSAPVFALLAADNDGRATQIQTGQVLERLYLMATALGLAVRPMSQIVELTEARDDLASFLPIEDVVPMQPFLLGYAAPSGERTPRTTMEGALL